MMFCVFLGYFVIYFSCETKWIAVTYSVLGHKHSVVFPGSVVYTWSMMVGTVSVTGDASVTS